MNAEVNGHLIVDTLDYLYVNATIFQMHPLKWQTNNVSVCFYLCRLLALKELSSTFIIYIYVEMFIISNEPKDTTLLSHTQKNAIKNSVIDTKLK